MVAILKKITKGAAYLGLSVIAVHLLSYLGLLKEETSGGEVKITRIANADIPYGESSYYSQSSYGDSWSGSGDGPGGGGDCGPGPC